MAGEQFIIPSPEVVGKYKLSRYVEATSPNGTGQNPFIKVNNNAATKPSQSGKDCLLNEVVIEAFEYQPVRVTTESVNGVVRSKLDYGGSKPPPVNTFRVLLDNDEINVRTGTHNWEDSADSMLSGVYEDVQSTWGQITSLITTAGNVASRVGVGGNYSTASTPRIDYQKVYKNTEPPSIDFEFTAITDKDFFTDIFKPIMTLTALTYPSRVGGLEGAGAKVAEFASITARQYSLKPPCLFNVYHQSGMYTFENCMCTSLDVTYSGPWYNATADEQAAFSAIGASLNIDVKNRLFPTIAKVKIAFVAGERVVRGDFQSIVDSFSGIQNSGTTTYTKNGQTG